MTCGKPDIFITEEYISSESLSDGCWYCDGLGETWDHIVPRTLEGAHDYNNLIPCCKKCNSSKGNRPLYKFRQALKRKDLNYQFDTPSPRSIRGKVYRKIANGFISFISDDGTIVIKESRKWLDRQWTGH